MSGEWGSCHEHGIDYLLSGVCPVCYATAENAAKDEALNRWQAIAQQLAEALKQIKMNAESQLVAMNAMKVPESEPEWVNAWWNRTEASAALNAFNTAKGER